MNRYHFSKIVSSIVACIYIINVYATPRTPEQALQVARKMLSSQIYAKQSVKSGTIVSNKLTIVEQSDAYYAINTGAGFVLVSSDDEMPDVLGYGDSGDFNSTDIPPALRMWLNNYNKEFRAWKDKSAHHTPERSVGDGKSSTSTRNSIAPLIKTEWGQDAPYNKYCPTDCEGNACPTGCVTTAVAQIMRYWQWPLRGEGEHTYNCLVCRDSTYHYESLTASFGETNYMWDEMLVHHTDSDEYSSEAVATLMYHLGVAQEIHYDKGGTGLDPEEIRIKTFPALFNYFGYNDNVQVFAKDYCEYTKIEQILYDELSLRRPVFVFGVDTISGGHAFICDGYKDQYFHFNWGWNGLLDGWFLLSSLSPQILWIKIDFNSYVTFFTGIQPDNIDLPITTKGHVWVIDSISCNQNFTNKQPNESYYTATYTTAILPSNKEASVPLWIYGLSNVGLTKYTESLGLALYPLQSDSTIKSLAIYNANGIEGLPFYGTGYSSFPINLYVVQNILPGTYRVALVYQNEQGEWIPVPQRQGNFYVPYTKRWGKGLIGSEVSIYTIDGKLLRKSSSWAEDDYINVLGVPYFFQIKVPAVEP